MLSRPCTGPGAWIDSYLPESASNDSLDDSTALVIEQVNLIDDE